MKDDKDYGLCFWRWLEENRPKVYEAVWWTVLALTNNAMILSIYAIIRALRK